jgi:hypothetical protein
VPGVKATKPEGFHETDLSDYRLFSVVTQRRVRDITPTDERLFKIAYTPPVRLARVVAPAGLKSAVKRTPLSREHRALHRAGSGQ